MGGTGPVTVPLVACLNFPVSFVYVYLLPTFDSVDFPQLPTFIMSLYILLSLYCFGHFILCIGMHFWLISACCVPSPRHVRDI